MIDCVAIERIIPEEAPGPRGDYSLVSITDVGQPMAYLSGQTGRRSDGSIDSEAHAQATAAFENLETLLIAVNSGPREIVHTRTFLVGRAALDGFLTARRTIYSRWFDGRKPPSSTLAIVSGLADPQGLVEIEAVAAIPAASFDNPGAAK